MTNTKKAEQIIKGYFSDDAILTMHECSYFPEAMRALRSNGFSNEIDSSLRIIVRDAIQNIVLERFEVVNNRIVEKRSNYASPKRTD